VDKSETHDRPAFKGILSSGSFVKYNLYQFWCVYPAIVVGWGEKFFAPTEGSD